MAAETIRLHGIKELHRDLRKYDRELALELNRRLKDAAELVRQAASERFQPISSATAAGFRPRARSGSAFVAQSKRRTTGLRPDFGSLQMRVALVPALESKSGEVERAVEQLLDELGGGFNSG